MTRLAELKQACLGWVKNSKQMFEEDGGEPPFDLDEMEKEIIEVEYFQDIRRVFETRMAEEFLDDIFYEYFKGKV